MVIGITGGIGSGKSLAGTLLREKGYRVISCDDVSREVVQKGTEGLAKVVEAFGPEYLLPDGSLDRKKLADLVFSDAESRARLNDITHPLILRRLSELVAEVGGAEKVFVEVPLLFESGMTDFFHEIWLVVADERVRLDRIVMRDGIDYEQAKARMASQLPDGEKAKAADVVLYNNGNIGDFKKELEKLL